MTDHDLTETYRRIKALEQAITAFSEVTSVVPSEDQYASLMSVMSDRIESEFSALKAEIFRTWGATSSNTAS
jgi:RNA processing factor Prp31